MTLSIHPLHRHLGAEIAGVDAARKISAGVFAEIQAALDQWAVIFIRGQQIGDEAQLEFAAMFGPLAVSKSTMAMPESQRRIKNPLFSDISNVDANGELLNPEDNPRVSRITSKVWHTDGIYKLVPERVSVLSGREVPPVGGDTEFAATAAAYDALPDARKREVDGLIAIHSLHQFQAKAGLSHHADAGSFPPVRQPLVRFNPRTGRKSLYLAKSLTGIEGWAAEKGEALIAELMAHATQPEFVYAHKWRKNDMVVWDDSMTMHRATAFPDRRFRRVMHRLAVNETGPLLSAP